MSETQPRPHDPASRPSRAPVYVVVVGLGLALAAVLIGAELSAAPPPAVPILPGTAGAPRDVNVIMRDYVFVPTPLPLVRGETIRLNVINGGLVPHELVLGNAEVQQAWASAESRATPPGFLATLPPASVPPDRAGLRILLGSGQQASVTYTVPAHGELQVVCHLPGHVEQGMVASVSFVTP